MNLVKNTFERTYTKTKNAQQAHEKLDQLILKKKCFVDLDQTKLMI